VYMFVIFMFNCSLSPVHTERVASRRRDHNFGLFASNVCIFIQLSVILSYVVALSMTSLAQVLSGDGV